MMGRTLASAAVTASATALLVGQTLSTPAAIAAVVPAATTNTVLVMGGNSNPQAKDMEKELSGYYNPATKNGKYSGYAYTVVPWSATTPFTAGSTGMTYDESQQEGLAKIEAAIADTLAKKPSEKITVVGYSSSANVASNLIADYNKKRAAGQTAGIPADNQLSFIVFGNPNRPNGGFFARYPNLKIGPPLGVSSTGSAPTGPYESLDVSWQYDGFSDYPYDPSNGLAVANAIMGFFTLHGNYYGANVTDPSKQVSNQLVGNTRYITLKSQLPLLAPLYALGIPSFILAPMDASLRASIEKAYRRDLPAGTTVTAKPGINDPLLQVLQVFFNIGNAPVTNTPTSTPVITSTSPTTLITSTTSTTPSIPTTTSTTSTVPTTTSTTSTVPTTTTTSSTSTTTTSSTTSTTTSSTSTTSTSTNTGPSATDAVTGGTGTNGVRQTEPSE